MALNNNHLLTRSIAECFFLSLSLCHIIMTPNQPVFNLTPKYCLFSREAADTNVIVFGLTPLYSKAKWDNVISDVNAIYNEIMNMENIGESVNSMWTYFQNNLDNSIKNNIPHKTTKNKDG